MLVLIAVLLALIPLVAALYPFLRRSPVEEPEDESSTFSELSRRWESAIAGLKSAELEYSIGNLLEADYRLLRQQYLTDAALVMKAMELEQQQEDDLLAQVEAEVRAVRERFQGPAAADGRPGASVPQPREAASE